MWISRKKWNQLEKRITELEKDNQTLNQKTQGLEESFLLKICTNSVMKEQYNFELLKHLFEKLNLEMPKSEYQFIPPKTFSGKDGNNNNNRKDEKAGYKQQEFNDMLNGRKLIRVSDVLRITCMELRKEKGRNANKND